MSLYMINATQKHAKFSFHGNWINDKHDGTFDIRNQKEKDFEVQEGDSFISFIEAPKSTSIYDKYLMGNKGKVLNVISRGSPLTEYEAKLSQERIKAGKPALKYFNHTITFKDASPFTKNKYLDDYTYSLLKIYKRYLHPVRHFSRQVTKLEKSDHDTLVKEKVYYERTVFGKLINALPYQNRLEFMLFSLKMFNQPDLRGIPISSATPFLKDFVGSGIITIGEFLVESKKILNNLTDVFKEGIDVGFIEEGSIGNNKSKIDKKEIDYLLPQAQIFEQLFEIDEFATIVSSQELISKNVDVKRFNKLFGKRAWPIDISNEM